MSADNHTDEKIKVMEELIGDIINNFSETLGRDDICHGCFSFAVIKVLTAIAVDIGAQEPMALIAATTDGIEIAMEYGDNNLSHMPPAGSC